MKKIWVNRAKSFEEAQDFDDEYYLSLSSTERVESCLLYTSDAADDLYTV